jgi:hypothetical protein
MGGKFLPYSAYDNNCQDFIIAVLKSNHLGNESIYKFVKQDTEDLFKASGTHTRKFANTLTDLGAAASKVFSGGYETDSSSDMEGGGFFEDRLREEADSAVGLTKEETDELYEIALAIANKSPANPLTIKGHLNKDISQRDRGQSVQKIMEEAKSVLINRFADRAGRSNTNSEARLEEAKARMNARLDSRKRKYDFDPTMSPDSVGKGRLGGKSKRNDILESSRESRVRREEIDETMDLDTLHRRRTAIERQITMLERFLRQGVDPEDEDEITSNLIDLQQNLGEINQNIARLEQQNIQLVARGRGEFGGRLNKENIVPPMRKPMPIREMADEVIARMKASLIRELGEVKLDLETALRMIELGDISSEERFRTLQKRHGDIEEKLEEIDEEQERRSAIEMSTLNMVARGRIGGVEGVVDPMPLYLLAGAIGSAFGLLCLNRLTTAIQERLDQFRQVGVDDGDIENPVDEWAQNNRIPRAVAQAVDNTLAHAVAVNPNINAVERNTNNDIRRAEATVRTNPTVFEGVLPVARHIPTTTARIHPEPEGRGRPQNEELKHQLKNYNDILGHLTEHLLEKGKQDPKDSRDALKYAKELVRVLQKLKN